MNQLIQWYKKVYRKWHLFSISYEENVEKGKYSRLFKPHEIKNVTIGDYSYISPNGKVSFTQIGKFCSIGANFSCGRGIHPTNGVSTAPMFYSTLKQNRFTLSKTNKTKERIKITIGNDVFIGSNVTVLDGVNIGDGAVVAAGAIVVKDVPPYTIVAGVPAKFIKYRFNEQIIQDLLQLKWWDGDMHTLQLVEQYWDDVPQLIEKLKNQKLLLSTTKKQ